MYVCHCGSNIAGVIDVEALADWAAELPHVALSRHYKYMCSDPGQELVKRDILEHNLNRIVVAACSPNLHEPTFRRAAENAGLNRFLVQMANIREQVAWVTDDQEAAYTKAQSHLAAAISRVAGHEPLQRQFVQIHPQALVVGGGIAGIQAALTLADAGKDVMLVEREPSIGGHMAMFDKTFPTLDCAACILTPKMTAVKLHPNIKLLTYSTVESVEGSVGSYHVKIRRQAAVHRREPVRGLHDVHRGLRVHPGPVSQSVRSGAGPAQAHVDPIRPGRAADPGDRSRDLPGDRARQVQEGLRGSLRRAGCDPLRPDRGRSRSTTSGRSSSPPASRRSIPSVIPYYGYGKYPQRLHQPGGGAVAQRRRADGRQADTA